MQLMELDVPMVLALNMMDEVRGNGGSIHINKMEELLGIPVVPIVAAKNEGVEGTGEPCPSRCPVPGAPGPHRLLRQNDHNGAVHRCLHGIMHLVEDHAKAAGIPLRFAASKLVEGDPLVLESLHLSQNEKEMLEHIICQMEEERGLDRAAAIADMRFAFIQKLCDQTVVSRGRAKEHERSRKIDAILAGRYTAIPAFIGIMALVFFLTFNVIGAWLQGLLESGIDWLTGVVDSALTAWNINEVLHSPDNRRRVQRRRQCAEFCAHHRHPLLLPLPVGRQRLYGPVAFVMDKLLRKIGLSGRSIVPMLIGFGCTVPGVMASRTLPSERDRKMTILLTPFMSCSAKLPIYGFFTAVFFPGRGGLIMVGLYFWASWWVF